MSKGSHEAFWELLHLLYKPHPWHGISIGDRAPEKVSAFIEIVPTDTVKYELDKTTGYLKVDRPQKFSNVYPTLYGFVPQTYCGEQTAAFCIERTARQGIVGDGDPLDICVLTEKAISHGDIVVQAIPIGGLRMLDGNQADDKIVAVMEDDAVYGGWTEILESPPRLIERLEHYFLTYKQAPGVEKAKVEITDIYDREEAYEVIRRSRADYETRFAGLGELLSTALRERNE